MFITYRRQIISVQKLRMTFTDNSYLPDILNKKKRGGERAVLLLVFMKGREKLQFADDGFLTRPLSIIKIWNCSFCTRDSRL